MEEDLETPSSASDLSHSNSFQFFKGPVFTIIRHAERTRKDASTWNKVKKRIQKPKSNDYKRKERSLEELSLKFLKALNPEKENLVFLDEMTNRLGVERRRIYDIINILESLKLLTRYRKNVYKWNGFPMIYQTIHEYQKQTFKAPEELNLNASSRRERSLEILSIGFLKLFLSWKKIISLEEAAIRLTEPLADPGSANRTPYDENKIKTRIRRLYDIANVFKSIGIIKKTHLEAKNKPAFEYLGYQGLDAFLKEFYPSKEINQEHFPKTAPTIIVNNIQSSQGLEINNAENKPPSIEKKAFVMNDSFSSFKKIKRTGHSPFRALTNETPKKKH